MTDLLKALLHNYGLLTITISQLSQRPGTAHATLSDYYKSLGQIQPDEPVLWVRISPDNEFRSLEEGHHDVTFEGESGEKTDVVTVWELPEDEYYYFRAFRPGMFDLEKVLPSFIFEMALA